MKRERIFPLIGLALLLVCFGIALTRIASRQRSEADPNTVVIRIAHWQLESGIRDAIDTLAREYERSHPGVIIKQSPIPERIYTSWLKTQLVGGTAPDIIQIGKGSDDETLSRFFTPLTSELETPNPYNAGTPLASVIWRETFVDGLESGESYRPNLLEYYGVPLSMFTIRIYYNVSAWQRILGDTPPPADYDSFIAICERVREHARTTGETIIPIAGSKYGTPGFTYALISSQTQRLAASLDDSLTLKPQPTDNALQFLAGRWRLDSPEFVKGLELARQVGRYAQPGFLQASRDDASFYFMQGSALMIVTGSWDAPSFRALAPFELGVFQFPMPRTDHPRYGAGIIGPVTEIETPSGATLGLTRSSRHSEQALDFLRYITSQSGNAEFCRISSWLPSVDGVKLPPFVQPFAPNVEGYVGGIGLTPGDGADVARVLDINLGTLFDGNTDISHFQDTMRDELPRAVRSDLLRFCSQLLNQTGQQDTLVIAQSMLRATNPASDDLLRKESELFETQSMQELRLAATLRELSLIPAP